MVLDQVLIYTSGGVVLWSKKFTSTLRGDPVSAFIQRIVLEGRVKGSLEFVTGPHRVHWLYHSADDLYFVAVLPSALQIPRIDTLLSMMREKFVELYRPLLWGCKYFEAKLPLKFDNVFALLMEAALGGARRPPAEVAAPGSERGGVVEKDGESRGEKKGEEMKEEMKEKEKEEKEEEEAGEPAAASEPPPSAGVPLSSSGRRAGPREFSGGSGNLSKKKKKGSKAELRKQSSPSAASDLRTSGAAFRSSETIDLDDWRQFGLRAQAAADEAREAETLASAAGGGGSTGWGGALGAALSGLTNRTLTEEALEPVVASFRDVLIGKNVAKEVAEVLCRSVQERLVGRTLSTFSRVKGAVREALAEALTVVLTPTREVDLLVMARRRPAGRPLVVAFCGVNGVGKSTNLGKITSWLQQNGLRVMIAACDTFRAGAVEQLRIHADNLGATLFHRGYEKEPAEVARQALYFATQEGHDVVLIDTAGRMEDNVPLMKSLVRLVNVNQPDLVFFVGEALVGNAAVKQLTRYNEFLEEGAQRGIDGIILTKFDTIDDKMGAAISMVHTTGKPIVFIGTGQNYPDLKKLNIPTVVQALLE